MPSDPLLGRVIDKKYRIDAQIGLGGMATVYRATRLHIGDVVAIKILHAELLRDPKLAERFQREAQAAARLKHPNVVTVHDFGVCEDDVVYLVMELVEGENLRTMIKEGGPMTTAAAAAIVRQVCAALTEAHRQNVIHRDIKPANIAVETTADGLRVKVLDFGIASLRGGTMMTFTQTGTVLGTPAYMSPEQCLGEDLDSRSDIYSLGVVLFEMLSGVVPFNSPTATAVVMQHVQQAPPPLRILNVSVSAAVEAVVLRALAKRREERPQSAKELADELSAAVAGVALPRSGDETVIAPDRFSMSQVARTMVQSPLAAPAHPAAPAHGNRRIGLIVALAVVAGGAAAIGVQHVFFQRTPSSHALSAAPPPANRTGGTGRAYVVPVGPPHEQNASPAAVSDLVQRYYALWNDHRLAEAYQLLSSRYRASNPFGVWERTHDTVVAISVATSPTNDPMTAAVVIDSVDRTSSGTVRSQYKGTWTVVYEGPQLRLDSAALNQTQ
jgi:tRNA A-37 threonylcarbamoyl transferase component Bud32